MEDKIDIIRIVLCRIVYHSCANDMHIHTHTHTVGLGVYAQITHTDYIFSR